MRALGFMIGAPTSYEFMERYVDQILNKHKDKQFIHMMSVYLAKLAQHHESFISKKPSLMGASTVYVALKICE